MRKTAITLLLLAFACGARAQSVPAGEGVRPDDETLLRGWIRTLASDAFGGRKPMTEYEDITVGYLAGEMEQLGL